MLATSHFPLFNTLVLILGGIGLSIFWLLDLANWVQARHWASTTGEIVSATTHKWSVRDIGFPYMETKGRKRVPTYTYEVDGQAYRGSRTHICRLDAAGTARTHRGPVTVYYCPEDPSRATLSRTMGHTCKMAGPAGPALVLFALLLH